MLHNCTKGGNLTVSQSLVGKSCTNTKAILSYEHLHTHKHPIFTCNIHMDMCAKFYSQ